MAGEGSLEYDRILERHAELVGAITALRPARQDSVYSVASFTRPANASAYAAGDYVANSTTAAQVRILEFPVPAGVGVNGVILNATLAVSTNEATIGQYELWIFDQRYQPVADNAAWAPSDAEVLRLVALVQFNTGFAGTAATGGNTVYPVTAINAGYSLDSGSRLYGALVVRNAYTPIASEVYTVRLVVMPSA